MHLEQSSVEALIESAPASGCFP